MASVENEVLSILFASADAVPEQELVKATSARTVQQVRSAIESLRNRLDDLPIDILLLHDGFKLTLKSEYLPLIRHISPDTELGKGALEVLALVAHQEPVLQSEIANRLGSSAYDSIRTLVDQGFIVRKPSGRSFELRLGDTFFRYFETTRKDASSLFK